MNWCDVFPQSSINMKVVSDALIAADQLTLLGMFDRNAALDFVDPDILLGRIETSFGFAGSVLDWMSDLIPTEGSSMSDTIYGLTSSTTVVQYGVSHGSILSPLFVYSIL